jgi:hypothetical protein
MNSVKTIETVLPPRIFARQFARELTLEEAAEVSGAKPPDGAAASRCTTHGVTSEDDN